MEFIFPESWLRSMKFCNFFKKDWINKEYWTLKRTNQRAICNNALQFSDGRKPWFDVSYTAYKLCKKHQSSSWINMVHNKKKDSVVVSNIYWPGKYSNENYLYLLIETEVLYVTFKGKLKHPSHVTKSYLQIFSSSAEHSLTIVSNLTHILSANCKVRLKIKASFQKHSTFNTKMCILNFLSVVVIIITISMATPQICQDFSSESPIHLYNILPKLKVLFTNLLSFKIILYKLSQFRWTTE